jgi:hypothetical protein
MISMASHCKGLNYKIGWAVFDQTESPNGGRVGVSSASRDP